MQNENKFQLIRNFSIIAHIDHGKSTLADRILEITHTISGRKMRPQFLDKMDIERERGITIKAQPISINYTSEKGKIYEYNLIDTPGHVDFAYEVTRSLAACEGVLLLVDASQGLEAQTFSHMYHAFDMGLDIVPVINKVDLENARVDEVVKELKDVFGFNRDEVYMISAKTGYNVDILLEGIIEKIRPPENKYQLPRGLIFDAQYDKYRGVILHVRMFDGEFKKGDKLLLNHSGGIYEISEVGIFKEELEEKASLKAGEVGYIISGIKLLKDVSIGDTIFLNKQNAIPPLEGFKKIKPMIYTGLYPIVNEEYDKLRSSMERIILTDSALEYKTEVSPSLGFGFRVGFLGLLHMEIIVERLQRQYSTNVVITNPSVVYKIYMKNGDIASINNVEHYPDPVKIDYIEEPYVKGTVISFIKYIDPLIRLIEEKRGILNKKIEYIGDSRIILHFDIPLSEIITNFFDKMKSVTKGYSSLDYGDIHYVKSDIIKVDILMNDKPVPSFSFLSIRTQAEGMGRKIIKKLRDEIPRHLFVIKIQAVIGGKIIAGERISALRKDVTAKCYGGDITRKRKLLEKQKAGKKKMRQIGDISVPKEAFLKVMKIN